MPKEESTQNWITRNRPPRVHITYDVQIGDAIEMKEIPFVVAVLGDFSQKSAGELKPVKDRKLIEIDRDNFDQVLAGMKPKLDFSVPNTLGGDSPNLAFQMTFEKMEDFHPDKVAENFEPLQKLVEMRRRLSDLLSKMDGNETLETLLADVMKHTEQQTLLKTSLHLNPADGDKPPDN